LTQAMRSRFSSGLRFAVLHIDTMQHVTMRMRSMAHSVGAAAFADTDGVVDPCVGVLSVRMAIFLLIPDAQSVCVE